MSEFSADQIWNNILKVMAEEAFEAGGDHAKNWAVGSPGFDEWWTTFVEQHGTDG